MSHESRVTRAESQVLTHLLAATAITSGAAVMMVEVLGARLMAPFFGVSLFVWTALIGVTLIALAFGYFAGGLFADRFDSPDPLFGMLIAAGSLVALVPALKAPVLKAAMLLGLRGGALTAALVLFAPALALLGAVSPCLLRLAAQRVEHLGRTAGALYALSTLGSFVGTVVTGFYLIALAGIDRIFQGIGAALIALGCIYFVRYRRRWLTAAALLVPVAVGTAPSQAVRQLSDGTRVERIASRDGFYGKVKVLDYSHGLQSVRELVIDGLVQGGVDLATGQSVYEYAYLAERLPRAIQPHGTRCLVIGLGIGVVPAWYRAQGVRTEAVDIDPEVVAFARAHFALDRQLPVHLTDARRYLGTTGEQYDYVLLDVFNGDTTPGHLLSLEAMHLVRSRLARSGVLAVNLIGDIGPQGRMTASVVKTLRAVFDQVEVRPTFDPARDGSVGNLLLLAYDGAPADVDPAQLDLESVHPLAREGVGYGWTHRVEPAASDAIVLTDDFNPIDVSDLAVKERVRRRILEDTHWDILLGLGAPPTSLQPT